MERDECIVRIECIADTLLKHCHYFRQNQDVNTLATLKNIATSIASELEKLGEEIE